VGVIDEIIKGVDERGGEKAKWRAPPPKIAQGSLISKKKLALAPRSTRSKERDEPSGPAESGVS